MKGCDKFCIVTESTYKYRTLCSEEGPGRSCRERRVETRKERGTLERY